MASATVNLNLKTQKFKQGLKGAKKGMSDFGKTVSGIKNMMIGAFAGVGLRGIVRFGKELVSLAGEQQAAEAGLASAMREKGVFTQAAFNDMKDYASELQRATTFGDEQTIAVQKSLVQFGLLGEELKQATKLTLDMGASGKNLEGSALLLGRAFSGETSMLSRYGVSMEKVTAAGGDFNAVLSEMNKIYGGQATALANTDTGKLKQMANAWGDIKESMGGGLAAAVNETAVALFLGADGLHKFNEESGKIMASELKGYMLDIAATGMVIYGVFEKIVTVFRAIGEIAGSKGILNKTAEERSASITKANAMINDNSTFNKAYDLYYSAGSAYSAAALQRQKNKAATTVTR